VLALASARRSVFLRRAARFFTLSLPWLFPIRPHPLPFSGITKRFPGPQEMPAGVISIR
jgi:hypothetical protein